MEIADAIITVVLFLLAIAIAWLLGDFLYPKIGVWGTYIQIVFFLVALLYISSTRGFAQFTIVPVILLAITIAWIIGGFLKTYIGDWGIFAGFIILLLEIAGLAKAGGWKLPE